MESGSQRTKALTSYVSWTGNRNKRIRNLPREESGFTHRVTLLLSVNFQPIEICYKIVHLTDGSISLEFISKKWNCKTKQIVKTSYSRLLSWLGVSVAISHLDDVHQKACNTAEWKCFLKQMNRNVFFLSPLTSTYIGIEKYMIV